MKYFFALLFISLGTLVQAQETINLAFYNVLNYPSAPPDNREVILQDIVAEMNPDIFMICELESEDAGGDILDNSLNAFNDVYNQAPYFNNTSSGADLQQLLYYNRNKFELVLTDIIETSVRDINRYRLRVIVENTASEPLFMEVFVAHLKASQGAQNELLRFDMVEQFTEYLSELDPNDTVIFAGDLNLYTSDEPAYQELINSSGEFALTDPIDSPGDWNNNSSFEFLHTQSTRISNDEFDDFGAGGGLDSRFDFILLSDNTFDEDASLRYVDGSYKAFGNNSNCFNDRIDSSDCGGDYTLATRELLYQMSDHLPVIAQLEISEEFLSVDVVQDEKSAWFVRGNVVSDVAEIAFAKAYTNKSIILYNTVGQQLMQFKTTAERLSMDTSFLADGVYYLKLNDNTLLKFIKTR
ncbi:T9SS C-terminal target domain-containing protein [Dokdonia sinensis]|uniref:T9SS C-terminal target domain-containing protein n=1 Tax=Dokdonia sinensis TaxID=2479847 RepID=A0A3M0G609_9FLAO|nr:T9SS type A sorting domain-containing protein [Dokdonia sinensis]RMB59527.1 T9SS C-terminal target domain-containing protein [Dokdonia sinensis]